MVCQDVKLIEIDTVNRALAGGDENSPKDMGAFVGNLAKIQETGAHVLVTHHVPVENSQRMRGHGALLAACDTTIKIDRNGDVRTAAVDKTNDSGEGESVSFTITSIELCRDQETGEVTTAPVAVPTDKPVAAKSTTTRKLSDRQSLALRALADCDGSPPPNSYGLPDGIIAVRIGDWQNELHSRGVIEPDVKNPRTAFKQIRESLAARCLIGERDGLVWRAG
jgi:hypothetical protein